jgi:hypothetical protein
MRKQAPTQLLSGPSSTNLGSSRNGTKVVYNSGVNLLFSSQINTDHSLDGQPRVPSNFIAGSEKKNNSKARVGYANNSTISRAAKTSNSQTNNYISAQQLQLSGKLTNMNAPMDP